MKDRIKLIISMLIFGSIGIFVKNINLSSTGVAFIRAVVGSLFLIGTGFIIKQKFSYKAVKKNILLLILSGAAIGFNWILLFQAYKYTTISVATLSYYFAPVFVVILSPVVLKEKLTLRKIAAIAGAMIGLFFILDTGTSASQNDYNHTVGILYGLSAAVLYASVILMNKFIKDLSGFETTLIQLFMAAVALLPAVFLEGNFRIKELGLKTWSLVLIVGIIHTGIAYFIYFTSMKKIKAQSIAILSYIDPISAVIFAALFLGEGMTILQVIGGILILTSSFISEI